jgi:hypothetical protein
MRLDRRRRKRAGFVIRRDATKREAQAARRRSRYGSHSIHIAGGRRNGWSGKCHACGFVIPGSRDRQTVADAAHAHQIFTHETGAYLCGRSTHCPGCWSITKLRAERNIEPVRQPSRPDRLRNVGAHCRDRDSCNVCGRS